MIRMESNTETIEPLALVGCPAFEIEMREVFPDQIDTLGDDCLHCQQVGQQVAVNLYLPTFRTDSGATIEYCCLPCVIPVIVHRAADMTCDHKIVAEWARVTA